MFPGPFPKMPKTAPPPFDLVTQIHDQQRHIKELQGLLKEAALEREEYKSEIERLRGLLDSITDITDRTYTTP